MARLPEGTLMQRAAAGLAVACAQLLGRVYGSRVVLLVGSGDNGGDALYAGARLARRGAAVVAVLLAPDRTHPGGLAALLRAGGRTVAAADAEDTVLRADLVLDGIVGIGGKGGLRPDAARLATLAADSGALVVAVDLPSGVEADSGEVRGAAVRADVTVTFGAHKPGLLIDPAREYAGSVRLVDIGLDAELPAEPDLEALQHADVARLLPVPGAESDKYRRGVVGIAAGSGRYPGAAVLAVAGGAARRGRGPYGTSVPPRTRSSRGSPRCWCRTGATQGGAGAGVGRGAGGGDDAATVADVVTAEVPVLIDADGLRLADQDAVRARRAPTLMTPHAGRRRRSSGWIGGGRGGSAGVRAGAGGAVRGDRVVEGVHDVGRGFGGGAVRVNSTGTGWLATAGSGDVLSGLAGSLLASGLSAFDAGSVGAYLHGLAGRLAAEGAPVGAHDVAEGVRGPGGMWCWGEFSPRSAPKGPRPRTPDGLMGAGLRLKTWADSTRARQ